MMRAKNKGKKRGGGWMLAAPIGYSGDSNTRSTKGSLVFIAGLPFSHWLLVISILGSATRFRSKMPLLNVWDADLLSLVLLLTAVCRPRVVASCCLL